MLDLEEKIKNLDKVRQAFDKESCRSSLLKNSLGKEN